MAIKSSHLLNNNITPDKMDQTKAYNFTNTNSTFAGASGEAIDETKAYNFSNSSGTFAGQVSGTITGATQPTPLNFTNTSSTFAGMALKIMLGTKSGTSAVPSVGDVYFGTYNGGGYLYICASPGTWASVQLTP